MIRQSNLCHVSQVLALESNVKEFGIQYFGMDDKRQGIVHIIGPEQVRRAFFAGSGTKPETLNRLARAAVWGCAY